VVFMLEYGLTFLDIAYITDQWPWKRLYRQPEQMPKELNQFIADHNQEDLQLWQVANKRLDEKVALMKQQCGAEVFAAYLQTFKRIPNRCTGAVCRHHVTIVGLCTFGRSIEGFQMV